MPLPAVRSPKSHAFGSLEDWLYLPVLYLPLHCGCSIVDFCGLRNVALHTQTTEPCAGPLRPAGDWDVCDVLDARSLGAPKDRRSGVL